MIDQHASLAEKFLKKGFWLYLFSFIIAPTGYIVKIVLSYNLDVAQIGIIYGVLSLVTLLSSLNDFGFSESLNKFIPQYVTEKRYDKVKTILVYTLLMQTLTGLVIFCVFFFGANYLAENYFQSTDAIEAIQVFAFFFIGINLFQIQTSFFQAIQDTFSQKFSDVIRMIFVLLSTLVFFLLDLNTILYYSSAWIIGLIIGIAFAFSIFRKKYYVSYLKNENIIWEKTLFLNIFKYAFLVYMGAQMSVILSQIDMQMVILMLGNESAGYYTNYLSLIGIPFIIIGPIFGLLFPIFSEMNAKGEIEKIKIVKQFFSKTFLSFSIAFSLLFYVFGPIISKILFGEKFIFSGDILRWSILFLSFLFLLQINFNIFAATGKIMQRFYIVLFSIFINALTNYIFIKIYGVAGAALATGIGWIIIWALSEYTLEEYRVKYDLKYLGKNIVVFLVISLISYIYIVPHIVLLNKLNMGIISLVICLFYGFIYYFINKNDFTAFIYEIKKIRN